jgi:hypothetical protein
MLDTSFLHSIKRVTLHRHYRLHFMSALTTRIGDVANYIINDRKRYLQNELTSDGTLTPTVLGLELHGMFKYMADATRFEDGLTGRSNPVDMEEFFLDLEE